MASNSSVARALVAQQADVPFVWGQGGRRMTPDDIARERALAARQMRSDYSPVAHWAQGLGRVADNVLGALRDRRALKAAERNAAEGKSIAELLLAPTDPSGSSVDAGAIAPVDIPASAAGGQADTAADALGVPPISEAPPPPSNWREVVNADPVAASSVDEANAEQQIARALAARPQPSTVVAPMYRPRDAIVAALTNPYIDQNIRSFAEKLWAQEYDQSKPQFFMSNDDRVVYDPVTGQSQLLYDAPEDFQIYADQMGLEPGTDEYNRAMADYVLRTSGPTAQAGRELLENQRQDNRIALEGVRQNNRMKLRATPTWSQANPRPRSSGGGSRSPTLAGVIAPILGKVSRGEALTAGEQQALDTYYRRSGGGTSSGGASGGQVIRNPKTGERMVNRGGKWVPVK